MNPLDKSASDSELSCTYLEKTPPNAITTRQKRKREEDFKCELEEFKSEIKSMMTSLFNTQKNELQKIVNTQKEVMQSNSNIEKSIEFILNQNKELQEKITQLETQSKADCAYITTLEARIEDLQRANRKANLEIKNVPKLNTETKADLVQMVLSLSENIGASFTKNDIKDIYRIRSKNEKTQNTPIIVETSSVLLKTEMLQLCKAFNTKHKTKLCAKHLGHRSSTETPIFVSEHLTAKGSRLHFLARDLVKTKNYKYCWTAYGKIYVRKDDNSRIITVTSEAQIHHLLQN